MRDTAIDLIVVRRCTYKGKYVSSAAAIKMEALLQLGETRINLLSPQTIKAALKDIDSTPPHTLKGYQRLEEVSVAAFLKEPHNRVLDRKVAIKFYFWADGYRAHVDPQALARVSSPSIIEILEASVVGEEWALFVTPFCDNGDIE